MYNKTPLTKEQNSFAAKHHGLILRFLNKRGYPEVDYYDIAVFGYISAVRSYLAREDLRNNYAFSTIAFKRMSSYVASHIKAESDRAKVTFSYDKYEHLTPRTEDSPEDIYIRGECATIIDNSLTPCQKLILQLRCENTDIIKLCEQSGVGPEAITNELCGIEGLVPELYELIAA